MGEELLEYRLKLLESDLEETRRSLVRAKQKGVDLWRVCHMRRENQCQATGGNSVDSVLHHLPGND